MNCTRLTLRIISLRQTNQRIRNQQLLETSQTLCGRATRRLLLLSRTKLPSWLTVNQWSTAELAGPMQLPMMTNAVRQRTNANSERNVESTQLVIRRMLRRRAASKMATIPASMRNRTTSSTNSDCNINQHHSSH